jgi:hypothetical protein
MNILKLFSLKDIIGNPVKKVLFLSIGIVIIIIGYIILINVTSGYLRQIISMFIAILGFGYFILTVIFVSFMQPIYLLRNKFVRIIFPLVINWSSFVFYMIYNGYTTPCIACITLILLTIGYAFSGFMPELIIESKYLFFIHLIFNWFISRLLFSLILFINIMNLFNLFYRIIIK